MAELLQIAEPRARQAGTPQWRALFELGFRPLYLAGCFWALVAIALWAYAPHWLSGELGGVAWHAHEMLWGFIATIALGFLLTAGSNWTGINPLSGLALACLTALWLVARVAYLLPGTAVFWLGVAAECAFFGWGALALGRAVWQARNRRNYGVPVLVLLLGVANALYLLAAAQGDHVSLMQRFNAGLLCMAVVALLVGRRVIPFFAMRAVPGLDIPMATASGPWQLGAASVAIVATLLNLAWLSAAALAITGLITVAQLLAWKPWAVRARPLLWILYIGYGALGAGLLVGAAHAVASLTGWLLRTAWPAHVIGVAGFSVLIIGMVMRTALGHLGRPLAADRGIVACYLLVLSAAALRLLALLATPYAVWALDASAAAWVLAFALYLWRFFPMMIRPRIDQVALSSRKAISIKPAAAGTNKGSG